MTSSLISNLPLFLLLIYWEAFFDIIFKFSAFLCRKLIELEFENFASICWQTILNQIYDSSLLFFCQQPNAVFELIFLIDVHWFIRDSALLGRLNYILNLTLSSLILCSIHHVIISLLLHRLLFVRSTLGHGLILDRLWLLRRLSFHACSAKFLHSVEFLLNLIRFLAILNSCCLWLRSLRAWTTRRRLSCKCSGRRRGLFKNWRRWGHQGLIFDVKLLENLIEILLDLSDSILLLLVILV